MNATLEKVQVTSRILLAFGVVLFAGFWALVTLFSDFPPHWYYARWTLYVLSAQVLAGFLIGMLLPLRWRLSIAAAWGSVLMGVIHLVGRTRSAGLETEPASDFVARFSFPIFTLLVLPAAVMLGGYLGSMAVRRWRRRSVVVGRHQ